MRLRPQLRYELRSLLRKDVEQPTELAVLNALGRTAKFRLSLLTDLNESVEDRCHLIVIHMKPPPSNKRAIAVPLSRSRYALAVGEEVGRPLAVLLNERGKNPPYTFR